ncbi:MAG: hypothetical protein WC805_03435 [Patescibacteria group bacterium]|jgi:hypothetical protein
MPLVRVSGHLVADAEKRDALRNSIVQKIMGVEKLGINDEKGITCLIYPTDKLESDPGTAIIVEVIGLFDKPERTGEVLNYLAAELNAAMREHFPETDLIQCFTNPSDPAKGFSESRKKSALTT